MKGDKEKYFAFLKLTYHFICRSKCATRFILVVPWQREHTRNTTNGTQLVSMTTEQVNTIFKVKMTISN